ncbi:MAG: response regulator [Candidatus Aminicenantes bacterium]|jgi:DNA-binding NtrC family response regulator
MNKKKNADASILIVDDNIGQCKTMSFILERNGYDVTSADNGPEAISIVEKSPFDIVFMDIKMPIMNGVETYKEIKKIRPGTKVIMMTAYAVEDLVQEALNEGAYAIIYKPLDIEKVLELVKKANEAKQGALILVVDDDPGTCNTLKNIMVKKSYNVGTAYTGEEAITMVQKQTFDILFIDMKLPTLNGLETYLAIKNICPETVAVFMTAYRQEVAELVEEAINNNAYACLYKPLDMSELLSLTSEILKKKQNEKGEKNG